MRVKLTILTLNTDLTKAHKSILIFLIQGAAEKPDGFQYNEA